MKVQRGVPDREQGAAEDKAFAQAVSVAEEQLEGLQSKRNALITEKEALDLKIRRLDQKMNAIAQELNDARQAFAQLERARQSIHLAASTVNSFLKNTEKRR